MKSNRPREGESSREKPTRCQNRILRRRNIDDRDMRRDTSVEIISLFPRDEIAVLIDIDYLDCSHLGDDSRSFQTRVCPRIFMRDSKPQITPTRKSSFTFTYFQTRTIVASTAALVNTPLTRSSGNLVKFDGPAGRRSSYTRAN